jgi:DNA-binding IclR family transcriptional regulator
MSHTNKNLVQSLLKGLDILSVVADADGGLRLVDIASRLALKPPTAHNLVQTLLQRRYLERVAGNRYRIGPAFLEVARQSGGGEFMRRAEDALGRLAQTFPEATVTLAEVTGDEIRFRRRMSPDRPGMMQRPVGLVFQPYANASGLAALAFSGESTLALLRERYPFHEFAAHLWESPEALAGFLSRVRHEHIAVPPFPGQEALRAAAPVFDAYDALLATVGMSLPWSAVDTHGGREPVLAAVLDCARQLSAG